MVRGRVGHDAQRAGYAEPLCIALLPWLCIMRMGVGPAAHPSVDCMRTWARPPSHAVSRAAR